MTLLAMACETGVDCLWRTGGLHEPDAEIELLVRKELWIRICALIATGAFVAASRCRRHLVQEPVGVSGRARFQFSIQQVMLLVLAVSFLLGITRLFHSLPEEFETTTFYATHSISMAMIALCAMWATMSRGWPHWRIAVAFVAAAGLGYWEFYCQCREDGYWHSIDDNSLMVVIVIASLVVVRSCGWRLVPRTESESSTKAAEP